MNLLTTLFSLFQRPSVRADCFCPTSQAFAHETQSFAETLARIAESQVGRHEQGGNNLGPDVVEYQKATWLPPGPWPWCAAFVDWCLWHTITTLGLSPAWPRPKTAAAYDLETWAAGKYGDTHGAWQVITSRKDKPETWPRRGDIVTFTFRHTGIVTGFDAKTGRLDTVEGNAGMKLMSDNTASDGVVRKDHHILKVRHLIRYVV